MGEVELLLLVSTSVDSSSLWECVGDGGTTMQRVVTFTLPLARFFTSHKSVSFFFIVGTLSTVDTVGSDESFERLDCILIDFDTTLRFLGAFLFEFTELDFNGARFTKV